MKRFRPASLIPLFAIAIASALVLYPLFRTGFPVTDDGDWMIIRLSAFFQSLRQGQFPVRFLGRLNLNYGYPVSNFLYPGFLYIGSLFHAAGLSYIDSVKLIIAASLIGSGVAVYLWLRRKFSGVGALLGSLSLILAPYVSFDIFKRGSVGEILAVCAASALFLAAEYASPVFASFAVAALVMSHNTLALMFMVLFILYLIAEKKYRHFWSVGLGLAISAFFWIPAIVERSYVRFDTVTVSNPFEYFASGTRTMMLPVSAVFASLVLLFTKRTGKRNSLGFFLSMVLLILFLATPASAPLWNIDTFSRFIQFPYRFLAVLLPVGAWVTAAVADRWPKRRGALAAVLFLLVAGQWYVTRPTVEIAVKPESFFSTNEATTTVADEYMPKWVKSNPGTRPAAKVEYVTGGGTITHMRPGTDVMDFEIFSNTESVLRINKIFYPGWGITLNGSPVKMHIDDKDGVMTVPVGAGMYRMEADFRETPGRFIVDLVSAASLVTVLVMFTAGLFRKKRVRGIQAQTL